MERNNFEDQGMSGILLLKIASCGEVAFWTKLFKSVLWLSLFIVVVSISCSLELLNQ